MTFPYVENSFGLDRALAAWVCGAKAGETVSQRAAMAQVKGERWGCRLCWLLDRIVERDHCAKSLSSDGVTASRAAIRAGAALWFGVFFPFTLLCWLCWAAAFWILRAVF